MRVSSEVKKKVPSSGVTPNSCTVALRTWPYVLRVTAQAFSHSQHPPEGPAWAGGRSTENQHRLGRLSGDPGCHCVFSQEALRGLGNAPPGLSEKLQKQLFR